MNENENKKRPDGEAPKEKMGEKLKRLKGRLSERFDSYLEERRKKLHDNDAIFTESLEIEKRKPEVLARGGLDTWFLLCVVLLLVFGAVMSFSASSVFAHNRYGDSAYFLKRYSILEGAGLPRTISFVDEGQVGGA